MKCMLISRSRSVHVVSYVLSFQGLFEGHDHSFLTNLDMIPSPIFCSICTLAHVCIKSLNDITVASGWAASQRVVC